MTPLFSFAHPMAFEVQVYMVVIALVIFPLLRRGLYPKGAKTFGSFFWPLVLALFLAPCLWVIIAIIWAFLL
ncbi:MAG: hypothetical protein IT229_04165 [Flavobacteriales bacterium]|nr:hypothetical protein [Flavobacteriales bacterium]